MAKLLSDLGGVFGIVRKLQRFNEVRRGVLVGTDGMGNQYFQAHPDDSVVIGRERWVERPSGEFDASQVPAEWHGWLHYMTDVAPSKSTATKSVYAKPLFARPHVPNVTGTPIAYKQTSSPVARTFEPVRDAIDEWQPDGGTKGGERP